MLHYHLSILGDGDILEKGSQGLHMTSEGMGEGDFVDTYHKRNSENIAEIQGNLSDTGERNPISFSGFSLIIKFTLLYKSVAQTLSNKL